MMDVTEIFWDPFIYPHCAMNATTVVYDVTVTTLAGEPEGRVVLTGETSAIIFNISQNQEYKVSIEVCVSFWSAESNTCDIGGYPKIIIRREPKEDIGECSEITT